MEFNIQTLIENFEKKMIEIDTGDAVDGGKNQPDSPMVVVYLGKDIEVKHGKVFSNLAKIWPAYKNDICFFGVSEDEKAFFDMSSSEDENVSPVKIDEDIIQDKISAMFGEDKHFDKLNKMPVYYIMETTDFNNVSDFEAWLEVIASFRKIISSNGVSKMEMLMLLLNERGSKSKVANAIKNNLSQSLDDTEHILHQTSTVVLSNVRADGVNLSSWNVASDIASALIEISNTSSEATVVFNPGVKTVAYKKEAKPSHEISQTVVKYLVDSLPGKNHFHDGITLDDNLKQKLGITQNGTLEVLDNYIDTAVESKMPSNSQFELFPRNKMDETNVTALSQSDFNKLTMGAWESFLNKIVNQLKDDITKTVGVKENLQNKYREKLKEDLTIKEFYFLNNQRNISEKFGNPNPAEEHLVVFEYAKKYFKYIISQDEEIINMFLQVVQEQCAKSKKFSEDWSEFLDSKENLHSIDDSTLKDFYEVKMRNFIDNNTYKINEEFNKKRDKEELLAYLSEVLDQIIREDDIYSKSFEEELKIRLLDKDKTAIGKAAQQISQSLTLNVPVYMKNNFGLGNPVVSAMLLKKNTALDTYLKGSLESYYYYNTGCSSMAEAMFVYTVDKINLINGEG